MTDIRNSLSLAIYSNSKKSIDLFKYMFSLAWNERKIIANLENTDKLEKEFINIAAHELRTPIQTIIGLSHLNQKRLQ